MATVYRKSLRGIDELAQRSGALSLRLTSYLLAVDGVSTSDELAARNPHLPSMEIILNGLMQQGYIEVLSAAAPAAPAAARAPAAMQMPVPQARPAAPEPGWPATVPPPVPGLDLEAMKADMVRDVSGLLGSDAAPVIAKIQHCRSGEELFVTMMGVKKIVALYVDKAAAEAFGRRYERLSS